MRDLQAKLKDLHWQPAYINVSESLSYGVKFKIIYMLIWRKISNRCIFVWRKITDRLYYVRIA